MAFPPFTTLLALATLMVVASLSIHPSSAITRSSITNMCSSAQQPERCDTLLTSDPRTDLADLPKLSIISVELLSKQAAQGFKSFSRLRDDAKSAHSKDAFRKCSEHYKSLQDNALQACKCSKLKQYERISEFLIKSKELVRDCEKEVQWINCLTVHSVNKDMAVACDASIIVNDYVLKKKNR